MYCRHRKAFLDNIREDFLYENGKYINLTRFSLYCVNSEDF